MHRKVERCELYREKTAPSSRILGLDPGLGRARQMVWSMKIRHVYARHTWMKKGRYSCGPWKDLVQLDRLSLTLSWLK